MYKTFLAVLLIVACPAAAEIYKWVDETGQVHYGEKPPGQGDYESIESAAPAPDTTPDAPDPIVSDEPLENWQEQQLKKRGEAAAEREARAARCSRAKSRLATLNQTRAIFTTDERGERHYYSDQQRAETIAAAEQAVERECD